MREEFGKALKTLGVTAFYPLRESARLGQVYLVDAAARREGDDAPSHVPTNVVLTNAAVPFMEAYRADRMAARNRFPCSSDKLSAQILSGQTASYYQQPDCPAAGGGTDAAAKPNSTATTITNEFVLNVQTGAVTPKPASPPAPGKPEPTKPPESLTPLELGGFPNYSLASLDTFTGAGSVPTAFASFLAAIGFSHSTSLTVQAEGVEIATLSAEEFSQALMKTCNTPGNAFSDPAIAQAAMAFAEHEMRENAMTRASTSRNPAIRTAWERGRAFNYEPKLDLMRTVFYLRGIRYIYNDTRIVAAEAAASAKIPAAQQPPALPNISMNVVTPPAAGNTSAGTADALAAKVAALQAQVDTLRGAVASNTNIQVGATFTRATARGIEMIDLFQRPLAFGYVPFRRDRARGLESFCAAARGQQ